MKTQVDLSITVRRENSLQNVPPSIFNVFNRRIYLSGTVGISARR
jgi:hypothetical protein